MTLSFLVLKDGDEAESFKLIYLDDSKDSGRQCSTCNCW